MTHWFSYAALLAIAASPVAARGIAQVPEANSITIFALGVLGVVVGRRLSMRKSDRED